MNYKAIAKMIYAESRRCPTGSEASRYRTNAVKEYPKEDRYYLNCYLDNIKKANHVSGKSPSSEYNARQKS